MHGNRHDGMHNLGIVALSIAVAILLVKTGALGALLTQTQGLKFLGSFVAGVFFVSVFTAAPATVVLAEISATDSLFGVAFFGAAGALIGDLIIFRLIKDRLSSDFLRLIQRPRHARWLAAFRFRRLSWLAPFVGALIVASPLPDELGLAMMGLSKMKTSLFIPFSFSLNFLGILVIGLIAKSV